MKKLLIVVDFQNDFIDGALGFPKALTLVDPIKERIKEYLDNNNDVIYTLDTHNDDYLNTCEGHNLPVPHCIDNTFGHKINELCDYSTQAIKVFKKPTFLLLFILKVKNTIIYFYQF